MKKIYILLTRTQSTVSKIVHFFTKDSYTHASIAFDREFYQLFSSTRKNGRTMFPAGPSREYLDRGFFARYGKTPCAVLEYEVEDEVYEKTFAEVMDIIDHKDEYKFNAWGLITCKLGFPLYRKNKFFCSQFVAEMLTRHTTAVLPNEPAMTRPADYLTVPEFKKIFEGDIKDLSAFCRDGQKETVVL